MSSPPEDFGAILRWWQARGHGEPPSAWFRGEDFPDFRLRRVPRHLRWPADLLERRLVVVAVGGGIDSSAATIAARRRWPDALMLLLRSDTGQEPADSHEVAAALGRWAGAPLVTLLPPEDLYELCRRHGRVPNRAYARKGSWCTESLKGTWLDRFGRWLTLGRQSRTTFHVSGLLATEPGRIAGHVRLQTMRFGDRMVEVPLLLEEGIDKRRAFSMVRAEGLPISTTYEHRSRHGCVPCRHWTEPQWRDFFRLDPAGFFEAADVEEHAERHGKTGARGRKPTGEIAGKPTRVWLLGRQAEYPKGLKLREWLAVWDAESPGWRTRPLEVQGLLRGGDFDVPSFEEGGAKVLVGLERRGRSARRRGVRLDPGPCPRRRRGGPPEHEWERVECNACGRYYVICARCGVRQVHPEMHPDDWCVCSETTR